MTMGMLRPAAVVLIAALALAGCDYLPFGYTPLKEIVAAPAQFEGREVKVKGRVGDVIKLPILGQAYTLQEGGAEVMVTTQGTLPAANTEVALNGTVKSTAIIGGQSLGLRIEETKRLR
jgi:hypothetical protein